MLVCLKTNTFLTEIDAYICYSSRLAYIVTFCL